MEEQFSALLEDEEHLLWCGRPEAFETLDKTNRGPILRGLAIKITIMLVSLILYILTSHEAGVNTGLILGFLVLGAIIAVSPFFVARRLKNDTFYGLTERRILRVGSKSGSVSYEIITVASLKTDADGHTTLLCGPDMQKMKSSKWRVYSDAGFLVDTESGICDRAVLYALPKDKKLAELLYRYLPLS